MVDDGTSTTREDTRAVDHLENIAFPAYIFAVRIQWNIKKNNLLN